MSILPWMPPLWGMRSNNVVSSIKSPTCWLFPALVHDWSGLSNAWSSCAALILLFESHNIDVSRDWLGLTYGSGLLLNTSEAIKNLHSTPKRHGLRWDSWFQVKGISMPSKFPNKTFPRTVFQVNSSVWTVAFTIEKTLQLKIWGTINPRRMSTWLFDPQPPNHTTKLPFNTKPISKPSRF